MNPSDRIRDLRVEFSQVSREHPSLVRWVVIVAALVALISVAVPVWYVASLRDGLPDKEALANIGQMDQATAIYDASDQLAFTVFKQQRRDVSLGSVSPHLIKAILAIEDQRFYDHGGFDVVRTASAALSNIRHNRAAQGGSTITQQLARQSFLTPDKTIRRKLQELILASRIESKYSKDQILELYLNKVYFGDGLYGVEAASQGFFGKSAANLTVAEAALLAGLVKAPSTYAPTIDLDRAIARRNVVLQAMRDSGALDRSGWESARKAKVTLEDTLRSSEPHGQYFKEQVRLELVERFGWERVYQGGLRVFTTLDMSMQIAAETAATESLKALDDRRAKLAARRAAGKNPPPVDRTLLQAALVAMDPATGYVRAMVGGRDFGTSRFNRAVQAQRQPGSAFKPFVYAAALEAGYTPATVISRLNDPVATLQGDYVPADGHSTADAMTLRTGLRTSSNRAAVRLLQEVGIPRTVQYARTLGVGDVPSVPSLALGSGEVTLQSMTAAYAAFANQGRVPTPVMIRRVEDRDGRLLYQSQSLSSRAVSETTAFLMSNMMADVINSGTAYGVRRLGFTLPAAGKTGTTNDYHDAWFIGYTPKLVTGVWVGFDQPRTILPNGYAADVAVPFWGEFMKVATAGDKPEWFKTPYGVTSATVCRITGKLAGEGCEHVDVVSDNGEINTRSQAYTEYFSRGTEPTAYCELHETPGVFGKIAGFFDPRDSRENPDRATDAAPQTPASIGTGGSLRRGEAGDGPDQADLDEADDAAGAIAPPAPEGQKKKGFWSRIFGGGGGDDKNKKNDSTQSEDNDRKDATSK